MRGEGNRWDRARMDAGIANPGSPHDDILHWATRLHCLDLADWRTRDTVAAASFDQLPEEDRARYLARSAANVLRFEQGNPLFPRRGEWPVEWLQE